MPVIAETALMAIVLVLLLPLLVIAAVAAIIMAIIRAITGSGRRNHAMDSQETEMIQEIYQSLTAMEKRIDNLEAILVQRERGPAGPDNEAGRPTGG